MQLWRSFGNFDGRVRFSTWMYRIALNVAISFRRRERVRTRHLLSDQERLLEISDETDLSGAFEKLNLLQRHMQGLDELNRALLLLYLDGNSYAEIASVLGISETNVATKINRLRKSLEQDPDGANPKLRSIKA